MTDLDFLLNETPPLLSTRIKPLSLSYVNDSGLLSVVMPYFASPTIERCNNISRFFSTLESGETCVRRFIVSCKCGGVQSVAPARRSFAFDRREVDVKVDFWKKNQGYITHSIFELEE